jgi:hypothetical protein
MASVRSSAAAAVFSAIDSAVAKRGSSANSPRSMCLHTSAQNLVGCIITKEM